MQRQKHDWIVDVFTDIARYFDEHDLKHFVVEIQSLRFALEQEIGANVVEMRPSVPEG